MPASGGAVGPGFTVIGSTSVGPTPVDDYFSARVTPTGSEDATVIYGCRLAGGFTSFFITIGRDQECLLGLSQGTPGLAQQQTGRLVVEQHHANHVVVDSLSIPIVYDGAGMLWNYGQNIGQWGAGGTGGLSPEQATQLNQILQAVYRVWPSA